MRILVTGASGFVGRLLCTELLKRGWMVRAAVRTSASFNVAGCEVIRIPDMDIGTDWNEALNDVSVVIHLAARVHVMHDDSTNPIEEFRRVNVFGTEALARASVARGVKRLVYVSSIKVNGERTDGKKGFTETDIPSPQDPYGISKMEAEQVLRDISQKSELEVVTIRPPLVYGPGVKGNFAHMLKVLGLRIPLPLASVRNFRSLIYVGNLIDALILCAVHPVAAGQTYLVSDGEDISTPDLLRQLGEAIGRRPYLFPCPTLILEFAGKLTGKSSQVERLLGVLRVDSGKIRKDLGWIPPYTLHDAFQSTGEAYLRGQRITSGKGHQGE